MKKNISYLAMILIFGSIQARVAADVVLTFHQNGVSNFSSVDPNYGDRVTAAVDGNGHSYDIIPGNGLGFTPNVEVDYIGVDGSIWTTGYGDLTNVFYDDADFNDGFGAEFTADAGFEVGIFSFDLAAFGGSDLSLPGIEIFDHNDNLVWSVGSTSISGTTRTTFDTGGIFASSLRLEINTTGLGGASDNVGIDNIHIGQVSAVPEPATSLWIAAGLVGLLARRRRKA